MHLVESDPHQAAAHAVAEGIPAAMVTIVRASGSTPRRAGTRMVIYADGRVHGTVGGGRLEHEAIRVAHEVIRRGEARTIQPLLSDDSGMCCGGEVELFIDPLQVRTPAIIFGTGHVARAVAPLLIQLGHHVTVVDDRPELLTQARFPGCVRVEASPEQHAATLPPDPRRCLLVMTHNHARDIRIITALSAQPFAYLGMLGAHRKRDLLAAHLHAHREDDGVDAGVLERVHAPIGLAIGALGPDEIAVAVAAELIALRRQPVPTRGLPVLT